MSCTAVRPSTKLAHRRRQRLVRRVHARRSRCRRRPPAAARRAGSSPSAGRRGTCCRCATRRRPRPSGVTWSSTTIARRCPGSGSRAATRRAGRSAARTRGAGRRRVWLVAEEQHEVVEPTGPQGLHLVVGERLAQIDAGHLGADVLGHGMEFDHDASGSESAALFPNVSPKQLLGQAHSSARRGRCGAGTQLSSAQCSTWPDVDCTPHPRTSRSGSSTSTSPPRCRARISSTPTRSSTPARCPTRATGSSRCSAASCTR